MKNAIWRSRAVAILGVFVLLIILFPGLPGKIGTFLMGLFSFCIAVIGFIGSRHKAYQNEFFAAKKTTIKEPTRVDEPVEITETVIIEGENNND